jgi:hypothetical protein
MQPDKPDNPDAPDRHEPSSPYGPQPNGVDNAAGGAESSPYETLSSDERERLREAKWQDRDQDESSRH